MFRTAERPPACIDDVDMFGNGWPLADEPEFHLVPVSDDDSWWPLLQSLLENAIRPVSWFSPQQVGAPLLIIA